MRPRKRLARCAARHLATGAVLEGYEIHLGETTGPDCARGWLALEGRSEGATSADGLVQGTYLHGLFSSDDFRASYLREFGAVSDLIHAHALEEGLDALAAHLETHLDLDLLWSLGRAPRA